MSLRRARTSEARPRSARTRRPRLSLLGLLACLPAAGLAAWSQCPSLPPTAARVAPAEPPTGPVVLTPAMQALAGRPAGTATGSFLDRRAPGDLRLLTYNVTWDRIFPDVDPAGAEKFQRLIKALDPDVLALQEIRQKNAADVAALLNAAAPLPDGTWIAHKGWTNVIASRFPLRLTADRLEPRGQRELALALVDLPDNRFACDLYLLNNHFKCCGGTANDPQRQQQADALVSWLRDLRSPGGQVDLPPGTPIVLAGDLNLVGGLQPLLTLLTGDIRQEAAYGPDGPPDWDGTELADAHPLHNAVGPEAYTWRNDRSGHDPARLDYVLYTDSVLLLVHAFVLDASSMDAGDLTAAGLERGDTARDSAGRENDHLPVIADFRLRGE